MSDNNLSKLMIIEKKSLTFYDVDFLNGDFLFCFEPRCRDYTIEIDFLS